MKIHGIDQIIPGKWFCEIRGGTGSLSAAPQKRKVVTRDENYFHLHPRSHQMQVKIQTGHARELDIEY